jgi:hypothetical protein
MSLWKNVQQTSCDVLRATSPERCIAMVRDSPGPVVPQHSRVVTSHGMTAKRFMLRVRSWRMVLARTHCATDGIDKSTDVSASGPPSHSAAVHVACFHPA